MALNPFADYFNHTSSASACEVSFSASGYVITSSSTVQAGEEIFISYGNHSNDFLLAEYGFILEGESNQWDEVELDTYVLELLSTEKRVVLEEEGFLGKYVLDQGTVCYRTQVALRLACLSVGKWRRFVSGADDGVQDQGKVDMVLGKILRKYGRDVEEIIMKVGAAKDGTVEQRDTLSKRWKQIDGLLKSAIDRIQS